MKRELGGFLLGVAATLAFFTLGVVLAPNVYIFGYFDLTVLALLFPARILGVCVLLLVCGVALLRISHAADRTAPKELP